MKCRAGEKGEQSKVRLAVFQGSRDGTRWKEDVKMPQG